MQKFKQVREAMTMSPYAIGMAQAKKMYGYGKGPATDLPKKVIKKAHEIAKRVKANESFEDLVDSVDLTDKDDNSKGVSYKGMGTDVVNKKKKLNPSIPLTQKDRQVKDYMEEVDNWNVYDTKTNKVHSTYNSKSKAVKAYNQLNKDHKGYDTPGGLIQSKFGMKKEEVEQVDELSKNTLASYANKAALDIHNKAFKAGEAWNDATKNTGNYKPALGPVKKSMSRQVGISQAVKKLAKEEVEQVDELSKKTLGSYVNKAALDAASSAYDGKGQPKNISTSFKRLKGIEKATSKLTKEEVEELDELSKNSLAVYAHQASLDAVKQQRKQSNYERMADDEPSDKSHAYQTHAFFAKKAKDQKAKRLAGIATAVSKMAREEVEQNESRGHKVISSFLKNRETAQNISNQSPEEKAKIEAQHRAAMVKAHNEYVKKNPSSIFKPMKENIEDLDELSRNTMSSYVSKASDAREYKGMSTSKVDKRYSGVAQASKKLDKMNQSASKMAREELDRVEEAKEEMPTGIKIYHKNKDTGKENWAIQFSTKNAIAHEKELKQAGHKVTGRSLMFGTKTGPRKNVNEDMEEVNELSRATYANYVNKAARRLRASATIAKDFDRDATRDVGRAYKPGIEPEDRERHLKNYEINKGLSADFSKSSQNRISGIERASKKLSK